MDDSLEAQLTRRREALDRLRAWLIQKFRFKREVRELDPDVPLFGTGLGLDSIDAMELIVGLKTDFRIEAEGERLTRALRTINTLLDLVLDAQSPQARKEGGDVVRD